jgi:hypothetical protein
VRRRTGPSDAERKVVKERAGNRCERCGTFLNIYAAHDHHRKPRQMGGGTDPLQYINSPSNRLYLCPWCHTDVESDRDLSYLSGWLVHRGDDPAKVPVKLWDGWFVLNRHGGKVSVGYPEGEQGQ